MARSATEGIVVRSRSAANFGGLCGSPFFGAAYNGLDTRTTYYDWGSSSTGQHDYRRDGSSVTAPVLSMTSGSPYGPSWTNYTPGISQKSGSTTTFQHAGIKNNDAQSSSSSAISATRDYDAWGNVISTSGSFQGRFGFGGAFGYQEDETGLKLLGHRYYDPSAGRFLTRDTIKDGRNWYGYCENNPLVSQDSSGLAKRKGFKSMDEAAKGAATEFGGTRGHEVGGIIFQSPDGTYGYEPAPTPKSTAQNPYPDEGDCNPLAAHEPKDSKIVGTWHTHPWGDQEKGPSGTVYGKPEEPSPGDLELWKALSGSSFDSDDSADYIIVGPGKIYKFPRHPKPGKPTRIPIIIPVIGPKK